MWGAQTGAMSRIFVFAAALVLAPACPSGEPSDAAASGGDGLPATVDDDLAPPVAGLDEPWAGHLVAIGDPAVPHAQRWQAVVGMAGGPAAAVGPLVAVAQDPDLRYYAVRAMGELGHPEAIAPLAGYLADREWGPRRYAALALGQIGGGDPASGAALEGALDDAPAVREEALLALTRLEPAGGAATIDRFWTAGPSTGLRIEVAAPPDALTPSAPLRLSVTLSNRTDHGLVLPPLASILAHGLYVLDGDGRSAYPRDVAEGGRRAPDLDEIELAPGASERVDLRVELIPWDRGVGIDHEWRPAPAAWALAVGSVRYELHRGGAAPAGDWTARLVWHPAFVSDLASQATRKDAFWTGKATSEPFTIPLLIPEP